MLSEEKLILRKGVSISVTTFVYEILLLSIMNIKEFLGHIILPMTFLLLAKDPA